MINVQFAIDFFDGTLSQRWDEAAIEVHLDELVTLDDPIEGAVAIGEAEIVDALFSAVLRLCFQCAEALIAPGGAYHYRYEAENLSAHLQTSDDGTTIAVSGFGLPSQELPARELLPALYACGVRHIELLERLEARGRASYDLPQLHAAATTARDRLARQGWI
jgi:hypothetical protein